TDRTRCPCASRCRRGRTSASIRRRALPGRASPTRGMPCVPWSSVPLSRAGRGLFGGLTDDVVLLRQPRLMEPLHLFVLDRHRTDRHALASIPVVPVP